MTGPRRFPAPEAGYPCARPDRSHSQTSFRRHKRGDTHGIINSTARAATDIDETATATLGAISGAVIGSVVGTIKGAAEGATTGARRGSHSTPAAALTLVAIALTGIAQWPIVAVAGAPTPTQRSAGPARSAGGVVENGGGALDEPRDVPSRGILVHRSYA
ncbi:MULTISPECIES: hypothetical protein [unclassified Rhodococcus (in: high G+C Gram-positive bacteria)]|uniref:hypothetical protein n=1 Tax=unclassified Rhodococcus (in: high G+C Gram-positive bacteria) TaxID=192944 RepID=UPI001BB39F75|nr:MULTISPECIES: hypothetical protein [unclassified Rhodococcus (in: high G+C Gram-positive bacteria)]